MKTVRVKFDGIEISNTWIVLNRINSIKVYLKDGSCFCGGQWCDIRYKSGRESLRAFGMIGSNVSWEYFGTQHHVVSKVTEHFLKWQPNFERIGFEFNRDALKKS